MSGLTELLLFALYWCVARNLVFTGFGMSAAMEAAANPRRILRMTGLLAVFAVPSTVIGWLLAELTTPLVPPGLAQLPAALGFLATAAILFTGAMIALSKFRPELADRLQSELTGAAFSILALGGFLLARTQGMSMLHGLVLTLACCAAFLLASVVMIPVGRISRSPRIPKIFRGLPAQLMYAAVITLPLYAMTSLAG